MRCVTLYDIALHYIILYYVIGFCITLSLILYHAAAHKKRAMMKLAIMPARLAISAPGSV